MLFVCLTQVDVLPKRLNEGLQKQSHSLCALTDGAISVFPMTLSDPKYPKLAKPPNF